MEIKKHYRQAVTTSAEALLNVVDPETGEIVFEIGLPHGLIDLAPYHRVAGQWELHGVDVLPVPTGTGRLTRADFAELATQSGANPDWQPSPMDRERRLVERQMERLLEKRLNARLRGLEASAEELKEARRQKRKERREQEQSEEQVVEQADAGDQRDTETPETQNEGAESETK